MIIVPTIAFLAAPAFAAEYDGEKKHRKPHIPLAGELVEYTDDSITIEIIEGLPKTHVILDKLGLEIGDTLTFDLLEDTRYRIADPTSEERPVAGSIEDLEIGDIIFVASKINQDTEGDPDAIVVANHKPKFNKFRHRSKFKKNKERPHIEISEPEVDGE